MFRALLNINHDVPFCHLHYIVFVIEIIQSTSSNINALFEFLVRFKSRLQQKPKAGNDYKSKTIPKMLIFALTLKCRK